MPRVTFTDSNGAVRTIDAQTGQSLMEAARDNDVPGIVAECGGVCACATCHVYVAEPFLMRLSPPDMSETPLLEFLSDVRPNSRLSCQIELTDALDGLEVETPASQGD